MSNILVSKLSRLAEVPVVGPQIRTSWRAWRYYRKRIGWSVNALRAPGDAPLRPGRLYRVQVDSISHRVSSEPFGRDDAGRVISGDWDQQRTHLTQEDSLYKGLQDRYERGLTWEETDFYAQQRERIERGEQAWGRSTLEGLQERYQRLDHVYDSMKSEGYRSAREHVNERSTRALDEICVHVARNGDLLFAGKGNHRMRLAKLLDLDTVVVQILVRHTEWQTIRDSIVSGTSPTELGVDPNHPDVRDFV